LLAPYGVGAGLVGFLQGEVGHGVVRRCAVPVELIGQDGDGVAGTDDLDGLTVELDQTGSGEDVKGLADGMRVPGGARSRGKGDADRISEYLKYILKDKRNKVNKIK